VSLSNETNSLELTLSLKIKIFLVFSQFKIYYIYVQREEGKKKGKIFNQDTIHRNNSWLRFILGNAWFLFSSSASFFILLSLSPPFPLCFSLSSIRRRFDCVLAVVLVVKFEFD